MEPGAGDFRRVPFNPDQEKCNAPRRSRSRLHESFGLPMAGAPPNGWLFELTGRGEVGSELMLHVVRESFFNARGHLEEAFQNDCGGFLPPDIFEVDASVYATDLTPSQARELFLAVGFRPFKLEGGEPVQEAELAELNRRSPKKMEISPLVFAAMRGQASDLEEIGKGPVSSGEQARALLEACARGYVGRARALLLRGGGWRRSMGGQEMVDEALIKAASLGRLEIVNELLSAGEDPFASSEGHASYTAAAAAGDSGDAATLRRLLEVAAERALEGEASEERYRALAEGCQRYCQCYNQSGQAEDCGALGGHVLEAARARREAGVLRHALGAATGAVKKPGL